MKNIFIIGSKGIPANYGGFETFVDKLTENRKSNDIKYHVSCLSDKDSEFEYNNARCFNVKIPNIGPAKAVYYDIAALGRCIDYIRDNNIQNAIIYILACRIGPFMWMYEGKFKKYGIQVFLNPDGHEWKRGKWNKAIKLYWKISEKYMVKHSDLLICDSKNIERYINESYNQYKPVTTYISYGADVQCSKLEDDNEGLLQWYSEKQVSKGKFYLIVGRFVPENNYETIIREFMKSKTNKDLVIITNVEKNKFYEELRIKTGFEKDKRIKFVGTVYDQELIKKIREDAYGYIHGHEVGGTNPSLLEALASTKLNLLLEVGFNKEVGEDGALYFTKEDGNLANLIEKADTLDKDQLQGLGKLAKERIIFDYSWQKIVDEYETIFLNTENCILKR